MDTKKMSEAKEKKLSPRIHGFEPGEPRAPAARTFDYRRALLAPPGIAVEVLAGRPQLVLTPALAEMRASSVRKTSPLWREGQGEKSNAV
jgi:hypothetical protein